MNEEPTLNESTGTTPVEQPSAVSPVIPSSPRANKKLFTIGAVSLVAVAFIAVVAGGLYNVYRKEDMGRFTVGFAKMFHLPIAKINSTYIPYSEYVIDRKALALMVQYDAKHNGGAVAGPMPESRIASQALLYLMSNSLVQNLADRFGVKAEQADIDALKKDAIARFKNEAEAEADLRERFGWDLKTYEDRVIKWMVLQGKIDEKIQADEATRNNVKNKAQAVLDQIKNGASFEDAAKQYGQDGSAVKGGDLGWFGKGQMVPEFEKAVFSLKKGELAPQLVATEFGYHIVRLDDTKVEKTKDAKGKMISETKVKARHILFRPDLQAIMLDEIKGAKVVMYGKIENPFTDFLKSVNN